METTKRRSDAFPYQVFPFLETQTMPGGSKFNAKKGSILLDNLHRYSVPLGTYRPEMVLKVIEHDDTIILRDIDSGQVVAEHQLCAQKGQLVQNNNHLRDHSVKIAELYEQTLALLGGTEETAFFLTGIRQEKPRYVRDQFRLLQKLVAEHPQEVINEAMAYCLERNLYSAVDCRDAAVWFSQQASDAQELNATAFVGYVPDWFKVEAEKRNIATAYAHLTGGEA